MNQMYSTFVQKIHTHHHYVWKNKYVILVKRSGRKRDFLIKERYYKFGI